MPPAEKATKDRARLVCVRCHDRKVRCDLVEQPSGRCRNCQRDRQECRRRVGTRRIVGQSQELLVPRSPSLVVNDGEERRILSSPSRPQQPSLSTDYPTPAATTSTNQHLPGFIGDLSLLSCPSDPEPVLTSPLHSLSADVTAGIVQITMADSLPPKSMAQVLVDIYFQELHWIVPVVSRHEVTGPEPPLLLLQSIYFAGGLMRRSKTWPQYSSPEDCYKKIKTLLFLDYERDKIVVLKALCLMGIWSSHPPQMITLDCPWNWTGMAIRLALQFGMHREISHSNGSLDKGCRRLWWFLFSNDTLQSICYGRPAMIRRQDFDVKLPILEDGPTSTTETRVSIELPRLMLSLSNIETLNTQRTHVSSGQALSTILLLKHWIDELSPDLRLYDANEARIPYNRFIWELYIFYFVCIILLYLLPGPHRHSPSLCSASIVASSCLIRLYEEILYHEAVTYLLSIHGWVSLVAAVPQIYCIAKFPNMKETCDEELDIIVSVLSELKRKYPSAVPVLRKIARFRQNGITFSGLNESVADTHPNTSNLRQPGDMIDAFVNIVALLPFPDSFSPKMSLLRQAARESGQRVAETDFMPFNVDEMSWTLDWLESNMSHLDPNALWNPDGSLY